MAKRWEEIMEERKRSTSGGDPFVGDKKAKDKNIPLADKPWERVLIERGHDRYSFLDDRQRKEYDRPYYDFNLNQQQNKSLQTFYNQSRKPIDERIDVSTPFKPDLSRAKRRTARPLENAQFTNIPEIKKVAAQMGPAARAEKAIQNANALQNFREQEQLYSNTKQLPPRAAQDLRSADLQQMNRSTAEFIKDAAIPKGTISPTPAVVQSKLAFQDQVKRKGGAFLSGLLSPIKKPLMALSDYGIKDKNGLYPEDGSQFRSVSNWYTMNETKLKENGYTKKQIKQMKREDLVAAKTEDERRLLNVSMGEPRRYMPSGGDQFANDAGTLTGEVIKAIGIGGGVGAVTKGASPIAQAAITGAASSQLTSFGNKEDIERTAINSARDALFYGAGRIGSDAVGKVTEQLMWKYGLQNSIAAEFTKQAFQGLGFDAAGYAATLPTYPLTGDQMPSAKDVAMDMAVGALFDIIPNTFDTYQMTSDNKMRMNYALGSMQNTYSNIAHYERTMPGDTQTLNQLYDALELNVKNTREVINENRIIGQQDNINRINAVLDQTEAALAQKRSILNSQKIASTDYRPTNNDKPPIGIAAPFTPPVETRPIEPKLDPRTSEGPKPTLTPDQPIRPQEQPNMQPQQPIQSEPVKYGRAGNKAYRKWGENEYVNADLSRPDHPYTQQYTAFFNKWYEAGRLNIDKRDMKEGEIDLPFPPFLQDAIYQAGKNDMTKGTEPVKSEKTEFKDYVDQRVKENRNQIQPQGSGYATPDTPAEQRKQPEAGAKVVFQTDRGPKTGTLTGYEDGKALIKEDKRDRSGKITQQGANAKVEQGHFAQITGETPIDVTDTPILIGDDVQFYLDENGKTPITTQNRAANRRGTVTDIQNGRVIVQDRNGTYELDPQKTSVMRKAGERTSAYYDRVAGVTPAQPAAPKTAPYKLGDSVMAPNDDVMMEADVTGYDPDKNVLSVTFMTGEEGQFALDSPLANKIKPLQATTAAQPAAPKEAPKATQSDPSNMSVQELYEYTSANDRYEGNYQPLGPSALRAIGNKPEIQKYYYEGVLSKPYQYKNDDVKENVAEHYYELGVKERKYLEYPKQVIINRLVGLNESTDRLAKITGEGNPNVKKNRAEIAELTAVRDSFKHEDLRFEEKEEKAAPTPKAEDQEGYVKTAEKATKESTQKVLEKSYDRIIGQAFINDKLFKAKAASNYEAAVEVINKIVDDERRRLLNNSYYSPSNIQKQIKEFFADKRNEMRTKILEKLDLADQAPPEVKVPGESVGSIKTMQDFAAAHEDDVLDKISKKRKVAKAFKEGDLQEARYVVNENLFPDFFSKVGEVTGYDNFLTNDVSKWIKENKERLVQKVFDKYQQANPGEPKAAAPEGLEKIKDFSDVQAGDQVTLQEQGDFHIVDVLSVENGDYVELKVRYKDGKEAFIYPSTQPVFYGPTKQQHTSNPAPKIDVKAEIETKELLATRQKELYNYLKKLKNGKKSAEYFRSEELQGVDELRTLSTFIRFTDDPKAAKLDVLQMEMAHDFPEIADLGMEEFAQHLVDTIKYVRDLNKDVKDLSAEGKDNDRLQKEIDKVETEISEQYAAYIAKNKSEPDTGFLERYEELENISDLNERLVASNNLLGSIKQAFLEQKEAARQDNTMTTKDFLYKEFDNIVDKVINNKDLQYIKNTPGNEGVLRNNIYRVITDTRFKAIDKNADKLSDSNKINREEMMIFEDLVMKAVSKAYGLPYYEGSEYRKIIDTGVQNVVNDLAAQKLIQQIVKENDTPSAKAVLGSHVKKAIVSYLNKQKDQPLYADLKAFLTQTSMQFHIVDEVVKKMNTAVKEADELYQAFYQKFIHQPPKMVMEHYKALKDIVDPEAANKALQSLKDEYETTYKIENLESKWGLLYALHCQNFGVEPTKEILSSYDAAKGTYDIYERLEATQKALKDFQNEYQSKRKKDGVIDHEQEVSTKPVRADGTGTLEEVQTDNVPGSQKDGQTVSDVVRSTGEYEGRDKRADGQRNDIRSSVGSSEGEVHSSNARAEEEVKQAKEKVLEDPKGKNFVIKEGLNLAKGPKGKYKDNIAAIQTLKKLEAEGRIATPEEQEILSKYVGWGGLDDAFRAYGEWKEEFAELKALLTPEEYTSASRSTTDAFYTPIPVIKAIYDGLEHIGFKGGRVLEPSCGVGNFMGAAPTKLKNMNWSAVELDNITGGIAKYLYPRANTQITGYEKAKVPDDYYDLVIGNVPFGNFGVADNKYPKAVTSLIHNYFIVKSLDKVRTGGIVAVITTKGTLEATNPAIRELIAKKADLIGAIKLPNSTFKANAGTTAGADLLILKKREPGTPYAGEKFIQLDSATASYGGSNHTMNVNMNEYFVDHPEMILGTLEYGTGRYNNGQVEVKAAEGSNLEAEISKALKTIKAKMDYPTKTPAEINKAIRSEIAAPEGKYKENAYVKGEDGTLYVNQSGILRPYKPKSKKQETVILKMMHIRDLAREVIKSQLDNASKDIKDKKRQLLNKAYDSFVKAHGPINLKENRNAFMDDPDFSFLLALEDEYNPSSKTAVKSDLFSKDTIAPVKEIEHVESTKEALIVSINETGNVDLDRMSQLTGKGTDEIAKELAAESLIFKQTDGSYEMAERYLSGNVRVKLEQAEALAKADPTYQVNVEALKAVQPRDLKASEISVQLGQNWIPVEYYNQFAAYLFDRRPSDMNIQYVAQTGNYILDFTGYSHPKYSPQAKTKWGITRKNGWDILDAALNSRDIKITAKQKDGSTIVLTEETALAQSKLDEMKTAFKEWLFKDGERAAALVPLYNYTQNNIAIPQYDGSHLEIKGANPLKPLRPHQKNAVWRIITSGGNTLLAHKVGAGKTGEMAAAAMALRQMGLIKKPVFVVPNHVVAQWGTEFLSFFPAANVLIGGPEHFAKGKRKVLMNKIATGDWDAIIIGKDSFKKLSMSEEATQDYYQERIDELEQAISLAKAEKGASLSVKEMETAKRNLEAQLEKKLQGLKGDTDNTTFEELGIDALFVDEAHNYKALMFSTRMDNVRGLGKKTGNQLTFDLHMKMRYLQKLNGGKGIVFATATPIMNSMAELYSMQKYLQYDLMQERGFLNFDAWARQYGEVVSTMEMKPDGNGYREVKSFAQFKNVGELTQMFRSFADVMLEIPGLKIPNLKTGKPQVMVCKPSKFQLNYVKELGARAEACQHQRPEKGQDNILKICTDGRKMALDQRLVDPTAPDDPNSKLNVGINKIFEIWEATKANRSAQMIFCDLSTPHKAAAKKENVDETEMTEEEIQAAAEETADNISLYQDIKDKLILKGIPANEIAFAHDAKTDADKLLLYGNVNKGIVRVLIGSTGKLGTGVNAQKKLIALHHFDPPFRPGDIEQRDGRILRQGNENPEVEVFHYVTEGTFDARMWDKLYQKAAYIETIMTAGSDVRILEDQDDSLTYAEFAAIASGNPVIKEQNKVSMDLLRLAAERKAFENQLVEARMAVSRSQTRVKWLTKLLGELKADKARRVDTTANKFTMTLKGKTYDKREDAGKALLDLYKKTKFADPNELVSIGKFAGFDLALASTGEVIVQGTGSYSVKLNPDSATGSIQSLESRVKGIDKMIEPNEKELEIVQANIPGYEAATQATFPKQAELEKLTKRNEELLNQLKQTSTPGATTQEGAQESDSRTKGRDTSALTTGADTPKHINLPEPTGTNLDPASAKKASEIFKEFSKAFNVPIKNRPMRGTAGTYSSEHVIRIKKANDIAVLCHETGHLLDRQYGFSKEKTYKEELMLLGAPTSRKSYSVEKQCKEGVAEFIRLYMTKPEEAQKYKFYDHFEATLSKGSTLKIVENLRDEISKLVNLSAAERVKKTIKFYDEKNKKELPKVNQETFETFVRKVRTGLFDETLPIEWAAGQLAGEVKEKEMRNNLGVLRGYESIALNDIGVKAPNRKKETTNLKKAQKNAAKTPKQTDIHGKVVGPCYQDIVAPIHKSKTIREDFMAYQVSRRAADYEARNLELPESMATYKQTVKVLEAKYPYFEKIFNQLVKYRKNNLKLLLDAGVIKPQTYNQILEDNPNYTPMKRDIEAYQYGTGDSKKIGANRRVLKGIKGGGQDIIDPEANDINNTFIYRSAAMRNQILVELANLAENSEDMGWLISKSRLKMTGVEVDQNTINKIAQEALAKVGYMTDDMDFEILARVFKPNYSAGANQVIIYRKGVAELYDVDPELYGALQGLSPTQNHLLIKAISRINQVAKTGIVFTPQYIYRNFARDTFQNLIGSRSGIHIGDVLSGFWSALTKDEWYEQVQRHGGVTEFLSSDNEFISQTIRDIENNQKLAKRITKNMKHPLEFIQKMIEPGELAGRIAEFKKTCKQLGYTEKTINEAIYNMRDLSVDFKRMGAWVRMLRLNSMINFLNPQLQGIEKDMRLLLDRKTTTKTLLRCFAYLTMPTLILWWLNKDNKHYQELPAYRKDFFFNIPCGDPQTVKIYFPIPKPFGLGTLFGALPERIAEKVYRENPTAFYGFGETLEQAWGVPLMPSALTPAYEVKANEDWRNIPILNQGDLRLPPELQYNQYTSETAKAISRITSKVPGVPDELKSPKQLDHLMKGYTGTLGSMALDTVDFATGKKDRNPLSTIGSSFFVDASKRPQTIDKYYDYKQALDYDYSRFMVTGVLPEGYKPQVREVYKQIDKQLVKIKARLQEVETLPESPQKEAFLEELRQQEIALMRGANKIYEKEYLK